MGVQLIKKHFSIEHIVHRIGDNIFIGSPYISQMLKFNLKGVLIEGADRLGRNDELKGYVKNISANMNVFTELAKKPDPINNRVPIFCFAEDEVTIIETHCECAGWPNTTHEGQLMYENSHFADKEKAIRHGISNAKAGVSIFKRRMDELMREIEDATKEKAKYESAYAQLTEILEKNV
tara:strand:- start:2044 stop:2580 length:537 start_codon:yes stop_codon:yes gene_type:complete